MARITESADRTPSDTTVDVGTYIYDDDIPNTRFLVVESGDSRYAIISLATGHELFAAETLDEIKESIDSDYAQRVMRRDEKFTVIVD